MMNGYAENKRFQKAYISMCSTDNLRLYLKVVGEVEFIKISIFISNFHIDFKKVHNY